MHQNKITRTICVAMASILVLASSISSRVYADRDTIKQNISDLSEEIEALKAKSEEYRTAASELSKQSKTLENYIASLKNEQESLKNSIELKQAEYDRLQIEIENAQSRINENSDTIGMTIAQYYYNDKVSTIERIASTENFSSFIDEEVHLVSISDTLAEIVEENKNLKKELEDKKDEAANIIADLEVQKEDLARKEEEQKVILAQLRESEAAFVNMRLQTEAQQGEKEAALKAEQAELAKLSAGGISAGDPSKGGYPYSGDCPQNQDAYADQWGMYVCECVSYAAWKAYQYYGYMPYWGGRGNANQWPANARAAGYSVSYSPKANTVGISTAGYYGHAVWIERVEGNKVYVSQYNAWNAATNYTWGEYSEQWFDASAFVYIDFSR